MTAVPWPDKVINQDKCIAASLLRDTVTLCWSGAPGSQNMVGLLRLIHSWHKTPILWFEKRIKWSRLKSGGFHTKTRLHCIWKTPPVLREQMDCFDKLLYQNSHSLEEKILLYYTHCCIYSYLQATGFKWSFPWLNSCILTAAVLTLLNYRMAIHDWDMVHRLAWLKAK